jgi:aspartyl-tRNA(Asn)/glutamyl-tRNA(Gln) amidotransferase subunit C
MELDDSLIDNLERLCRLHFEATDREAIKQDLSKMLDLVDRIIQLDTEGVEPLIHLTLEDSHYRAAEAIVHLDRSDALLNAPHADSDYFRVPRYVDK